MSHAGPEVGDESCWHLANKFARCHGIRRIVQDINMLLRVQAPVEQYLHPASMAHCYAQNFRRHSNIFI